MMAEKFPGKIAFSNCMETFGGKMKKPDIFVSIKNNFHNLIIRNTEESIDLIIPFGILGVTTVTLFYFLNPTDLPGAYENLPLRIVGSLLCLPLVLKNYWPKKLLGFLPIYWYLVILYNLPFFFFFMFLKNHFSQTWLMNMYILVLLLVLLVDWLSLIILITSGFLLAFPTYILTAGVISVPPHKDVFMSCFTTILIYAFFSKSKQKLERERLGAMRSLSASIAHELRTPLRTIVSASHGIKKFFPPLLDGYQLAKKEKLPVPNVTSTNLETLLTACDDIESEAQAAFTVINMLLMNVSQTVDTSDFKICSIEHCIDEALRRYPFDIGESELVYWNHQNDFKFKGNELLVIHVLFNLLKNALYQIKVARKGKIQIWAEQGSKYNLLHFKDTGMGIPPKILVHIFDRFFSRTYHGTGIGLAFCRIVMENLGGKITAQSKENEYAEFILHFPNS
jgi:signal transduction histidine kinase